MDILYQDHCLIVVNKPSGLLVHRSMIDRHETRFAMQLVRDQIGQHVFPLHRLDKPTSGVLVFALSSDTARGMGQQFEQGAVEKTYLAVVRGTAPESGIIDHALKEKHDKMTDRKACKDKPAQEAISEFRRLETVELPVSVDRYPTSRYSLVEVKPKTGRKHQIRRHMKHIAHPVIGDPKYGKSIHNHFFAKEFGASRLMLACTEMSLLHPKNGERLVFQAPLDQAFTNLFEQFGWSNSFLKQLP
nr:tRNA pseudouridine(65) synthase TruC [Sansalvadorimonas sp. 2012CJ34-2]